MSRKILALMFLVLSLSFLSYALYRSFSRPKPLLTATPEVLEPVELTGVIRTTGLTPEGKAELNIPDSQGNYQLVAGKGDERYFILAPDSGIEGMIGKCVLIKVTEDKIVQPGSRLNQRIAYEFPKTVLIDEQGRVDIQDFSKCNPYPEPASGFKKEDFRVFTGTLQRETRPGEDIGYDYTLYVPEGFKEMQNAAGLPDLQWNRAVIIPGNNSVWKDFELYMGKTVTIEGYSAWGYVETRHYIITKVIPLEPTRGIEPRT